MGLSISDELNFNQERRPQTSRVTPTQAHELIREICSAWRDILRCDPRASKAFCLKVETCTNRFTIQFFPSLVKKMLIRKPVALCTGAQSDSAEITALERSYLDRFEQAVMDLAHDAPHVLVQFKQHQEESGWNPTVFLLELVLDFANSRD